MSYYIAPHNDYSTGDTVIYRVVKRLGDFKPENGKKYRVFASKRHMKSKAGAIPVYIGKAGKLKKLKNETIWRIDWNEIGLS